MSTSLSKNLCPKCHNPVRLPEEDVVVVKMKTGLKGRQEDRMVHKVLALVDPLVRSRDRSTAQVVHILRRCTLRGASIRGTGTSATAKSSRSNPVLGRRLTRGLYFFTFG